MNTTTSTRGAGRIRAELLSAMHNDLQIAQDMLSRFAGDLRAGTSASTDELRAMLRQLVRDAKIALTELDAASSADRRRFVTSTREQLDDWRAALDDLRVQVSLGEMTSRDRTQAAVAAAERAWSVAQQRLELARNDVETSWDAVREGINDAMRQLADAVRLAIKSLTESAAA